MQEAEADHIGVFVMAFAGYDPDQAVAFWERMLGAAPVGLPEFLSDHPSTGHRIRDLRGWGRRGTTGPCVAIALCTLR
jgi:metalloendopeptidase OMA1, mitochondrial